MANVFIIFTFFVVSLYFIRFPILFLSAYLFCRNRALTKTNQLLPQFLAKEVNVRGLWVRQMILHSTPYTPLPLKWNSCNVLLHFKSTLSVLEYIWCINLLFYPYHTHKFSSKLAIIWLFQFTLIAVLMREDSDCLYTNSLMIPAISSILEISCPCDSLVWTKTLWVT